MHWRRKWQPTPVFLMGESQGQGSLVGCHLWGLTELDTTEATSQLYTDTERTQFNQKQQEIKIKTNPVDKRQGPTVYSKRIHTCVKKVKMLVTQSYLTLWEPIDCSPRGSSVHGISQARILEWVAIPFSRESFQPRIKPRSSALQADSLLSEPPEKPHIYVYIGSQKYPGYHLLQMYTYYM